MSVFSVLEAVFWLSVVALIYTYAGYPVLLIIASWVRSRPVLRKPFEPVVSVIIAAYNEEADIAAKLENTLALDYPKSKLEIIVASDCSTDRTDEIVRTFVARGVILHRQAERLGKTAAQNSAVERARGDIVLFSDATTIYQPDVLLRMLPSFADPSVGCVTGTVIYKEPGKSTVGRGTSSYWNYEFMLKKYEGSLSSLIGVCGCMYAVRKSAYIPLYNEACSDFVIATVMVKQQLRAVFEPEAICSEEPNLQAHKEMGVRVRIAAQTLADLWRNRDVLNPVNYGFYSFQLLSHKVFRYLAPLFLILAFITSGALALTKPLYAVAFIVQCVIYAVAGIGWLIERAGVSTRWIAVPQYFVVGNLASLIALGQLLRGERYIRWEPVRSKPTGNTSTHEVISRQV